MQRNYNFHMDIIGFAKNCIHQPRLIRLYTTYPDAVEPWRIARQMRERRAMIDFILVLKLSER